MGSEEIMKKTLHYLPYLWRFPWSKKEYGDAIVFNLWEWDKANREYEKFEETLIEAIEELKPKIILCEGSVRENDAQALNGRGKLKVKNDKNEIRKFETAWRKYFPQKATSLYPESYILRGAVLEEIEDRVNKETDIVFLDANSECRKILSSYYKDLSKLMSLLESRGISLENYTEFEKYYTIFNFQRIEDIGIKREEKWVEIIKDNYQEPSLLICCPSHVALYNKMPEVIPNNERVRNKLGHLPKLLENFEIKHYKTPLRVRMDVRKREINELKNFVVRVCYLTSVFKGFHDGIMGEITNDLYYALFLPTYIHTLPFFLGYALLHETDDEKNGIKQRLKDFGKITLDYAAAYGLGIVGGWIYKTLFE